ncbi:MAG: VIT1/CCC1 transporter family protein [Bacteroidia bacterium]|nr:VIT1/CCC1 transporter family protein [Bacteroidia bacterium]
MDTHLHHNHEEKHFTGSEIVRDVVIGMSDGLTVPFALAAGLSGAVDSNGIIITAGIAEIIAGSIAMGLGGYLAGKTEVEHYDAELKREYYEVDVFPEKEKQEVRDVFQEYGISKTIQDEVADDLAKDKKRWVDFMMKFELGLEKPSLNRARQSALTIGVSYVVGGLVPLLAYFFSDTPESGLIYSSAITLICLFIFGYFKSKLIGQHALKGGFRIMAIGAMAAAAAFFVAKLFGS